MDELLCHVTTRAALGGAQILGAPFLHCCTQAQLGFVLARHFAGHSGLMVLRFGPGAVVGRLVWERSEPDQDPFPHLYGALELAAVEVSAAPGAWGA